LLARNIFEFWLRNLVRLLSNYDLRRLIICGDLKESVGQPRSVEVTLLKELQQVLLQHSVEAMLLKGNHDGSIESYIEFQCLDYILMEVGGRDVIVAHGHRRLPVENAKGAILAHMHPSIRLNGSTSFVWLFFKRTSPRWGGVVVMPPFNPFLGGGRVMGRGSPALAQLGIPSKIWSSAVIGVNGAYYGTLDDVQAMA
jgi:metallophosphoesterase superfamily enzyme